MSLELATHNSKSLADFCRHVIGRYAEKWPPSEEALAKEFLKYFGRLDPILGRADLEKLAQTLGIQISVAGLPEDLAGCHFCFGGRRSILVSDNHAYVWSQEHTIIHELREMMEHVFREFGWPILTETTQEIRAEEFAISVRVAASMEVWEPLLEATRRIESKWRQVGATVLLFAGMIVFRLTLIMLPAYENYLLNLEKRRVLAGTRNSLAG